MNFLSPTHIVVILVVALLLFGSRLPEIARGLGRSINEFKRGLREVNDEIDTDDKPKEKLTSPPDGATKARSTEKTAAGRDDTD